MTLRPAIFLRSVFGASLQQIGLDVGTSGCQFFFDWINYLNNQVEASLSSTKWNLELKSEREIFRIIKEPNINNIRLENPNEVFNYLIILLDRLPAPIIPEIYFNAHDKIFIDLKIVGSLERDVITALQNLLANVRKARLSIKDKTLIEETLVKSLIHQWAEPGLSLTIEANDNADSSDLLDQFRQMLVLRELKVIQEIEDMIKSYAGNFIEVGVNFKVCRIKLEIVSKAVATAKHIVDDYHYQHFFTCMQRLATMIKAKTDDAKHRLFKSRYLFIEVQKLLIEAQYHLDIFVHYLLQEAEVNWLNDEETQRKFHEALIECNIEDHAKEFWKKVFGIDKIIVQREVFGQRFKEHCPSASVFYENEFDRFLSLLDKFGTGFVTIFTFADLMRSFGNHMPLVKLLLNHPGFFGHLDGSSGEELLKGHPRDVYLISFDKTLVIEYIYDKYEGYAVMDGESDLPIPVSYKYRRQRVEVKPKSLFEPRVLKSKWYDEFYRTYYMHIPHCITTGNVAAGFMGDLLSDEVPLVPYGHYVIRHSSRSCHLAVTYRTGQTNSHERFQIDEKMRIFCPYSASHKYFDTFSDFLQNRILDKPFVPNHRVYQTDDEKKKSFYVEVSDPWTLNSLLKQKPAQPFRIKLKKAAINVDSEDTPYFEELSEALLENESLTSIDLTLNFNNFPLLQALKYHPSLGQLSFSPYPSEQYNTPELFPTAVYEELITSLPKLETLKLTSECQLDVLKRVISTKRLAIEVALKSPQVLVDFAATLNGESSLAQEEQWTVHKRMKSVDEWVFRTSVSKVSNYPWKNVPVSATPAIDIVSDTSYHRPYCHMNESMQSNWMYWSLDDDASCCTEQDFIKFNDPEKTNQIEHLTLHKLDISFTKTILNSLGQFTELKSLVFLDTVIPNNLLQQLLNVLPTLPSLRVVKLGTVARTTDFATVLETLPNLLWFEVDQRLDEKAAIIALFRHSMVISLSHDNVRSNSYYIHYATLAYKRRQELTAEIQDWVVNVISIVHCSALFDILPIEIWELIFSSFSFSPYLDAIKAFRTIRKSAAKVVKVVDWDIIKPLIAQNLIFSC